MDQNATAVERAFQLARSGNYATIDAVKLQLRGEGYSDHQVVGRSLAKQLNALIKGARENQTPTLPA
jgi:hypothetical protein